jgi:hypothetical protein
MTHVHSIHGWTVSFPIVGQRRRFIGYGDGPVGRAFFTTRKAAREYLRTSTMARKWRGRVIRATLTLKAKEN